MFLGIDPGASGGLALVDDKGGLVSAVKMPSTEADIADWFAYREIEFGLIEKVHAMPKQGVTSTFKFGRNYGFLRGILIAFKIPFDEVRPQEWQKSLQCLSGGNKNVTKGKAQQLFPHIKVTHATADALLIAEHCRRECRNHHP